MSNKFENYRDVVLEEYEKGNIVVFGCEDAEIYNLKNFIKQPIEGILYDLNRGEEVILTFIKDQKWVNDYASTKIIRELKKENEQLEHEKAELIEFIKKQKIMAEGYFDYNPKEQIIRCNQILQKHNIKTGSN
jgi:hypothetical protein